MINTPRKNGYSFKYGTLFYVPFFSCHLGISETFIRLYIYAIDFLLISSIFSNLSLKIFFIINRVLEHSKKNKKMEIEKFIKSLARKAKLGGRYSTANTYLYTLHSFQKFAGKASLTFEEITPESIKEYEQYLILNGKRYNTISLYMRMLRSICNQASEQNIASLNTRELFENVFIGNEPTAKRAISPVLISRLLEADFSKNSRLDFARDLFLLSFYLRGIPFVDLVHLRKTDVQGNMLVYFRQKTGQQLTVIIENCAKVILRKYASLCKESVYLLPVISAAGEEGHKQYRSALRVYNKRLNQISGILKLKTPLTSYVARHSWATTALQKGVPVSVISAGMGHASEKVTYIYLASFDNKTLSNANKKVIAAVRFKKEEEE